MNLLTKLLAMKKQLTFVLAFLPFLAFAQQQSLPIQPIDPRLYEAYDKAYVDKVAQEDSFLLQRWTYYLDHAFYVADGLTNKDGTPVDAPSVSVPDLAHLNILKLETEQKTTRDYYVEKIYKIVGTNKFLVYYSGRNFIESLNEHLRSVQDGAK